MLQVTRSISWAGATFSAAGLHQQPRHQSPHDAHHHHAWAEGTVCTGQISAGWCKTLKQMCLTYWFLLAVMFNCVMFCVCADRKTRLERESWRRSPRTDRGTWASMTSSICFLPSAKLHPESSRPFTPSRYTVTCAFRWRSSGWVWDDTPVAAMSLGEYSLQPYGLTELVPFSWFSLI